MPKAPKKESEVKVEEEAPENPAPSPTETSSFDFKKIVLVAGLSFAGLWLLSRRKNGQKTQGTVTPITEGKPGGSFRRFVDTFPRGSI